MFSEARIFDTDIFFLLHYFFVSLFHLTPVIFVLALGLKGGRGRIRGKDRRGGREREERRKSFIGFLPKDSDSTDLNWTVM